MTKQYDFTGFIRENQRLIFGTSADYTEKYKRNIAALDREMNRLLLEKNAISQDPRLFLGLFDMSLNRLGVFVKTDVARYQDAFYRFLAEGSAAEGAAEETPGTN